MGVALAVIVTATRSATAELVRSARHGDLDAYEQLVRRYERQVWSVARGFRLSAADTHDVVQATWLRLVENLDRLRDPDRLGGWLATTARREGLRILSRHGRELPHVDSDLAELVDTRAASLEEQTIDKVMAAAIREQVARLPARGQALLRALFHSDELTYADISRQLGLPIGSIGPSRGRYLSQLRTHMEQNGLDPTSWR